MVTHLMEILIWTDLKMLSSERREGGRERSGIGKGEEEMDAHLMGILVWRVLKMLSSESEESLP